MMRPDYQAELLSSFQEERRQKLAEERARQHQLQAAGGRWARLLNGSGAFLIVIGSCIQRWSGPQAISRAGSRVEEIAW